jgi:hypothetical protein
LQTVKFNKIEGVFRNFGLINAVRVAKNSFRLLRGRSISLAGHTKSFRTVVALLIFIAAMPLSLMGQAGSNPSRTNANQQEMPNWKRRGLPGPGHAALDH